MNLLSKFEEIEVKANCCISETDKRFCEAHQKAYESALSCFQEMSYIWEDIYKQQSELLSSVESESNRVSANLSSNNFHLSDNDIKSHIKSLHSKFICRLVNHFNRVYHVSVSSDTIIEALIPKEPNRYRDTKEQLQSYENKMSNLVLHYDKIIALVLIQLDGRDFAEQALYELKEKCHDAAWFTNPPRPRYEVKKDILRFSNGCYQDRWSSSSPWQLREDLKNVLHGIAFFETQNRDFIPREFSDILRYSTYSDDIFSFSSCTKVRQLKMFKNGRVDIKFTSALYAKQFADEFLILAS